MVNFINVISIDGNEYTLNINQITYFKTPNLDEQHYYFNDNSFIVAFGKTTLHLTPQSGIKLYNKLNGTEIILK